METPKIETKIDKPLDAQKEFDKKPIQQEVGALREEVVAQKEQKVTSIKDYIKGDIEEGKSVEVDFLGDIRAEYNVGLSELMPRDVRKVRIEGERFGRKYYMEGSRKGMSGGFFDEKTNQYMPVFTGFKVTIIDTATPEELEAMEKANAEKLDKIRKNPKIQDFINKYGSEQTDKILNKSVEYGIDPMLLLALRRTENGAEGKDFGIMRDGVDTFDSQLNFACRTIQNNIARYENVAKKPALAGDGNVSPEFVCFLSNIYAPIGADNDPNNLNKNHFKNWLKIYGDYIGKDYDEAFVDNVLQQSYTIRQAMLDGVEVTGKTTPEDLIRVAHYYMGMRYQMGGTGVTSIDCSQLVVQAMKETGVVSFNYDNSAQGLYGICNPKSPSEVKRGDLVFLQESSGKISHVEIAQGPMSSNGIPIIDASSNEGKVAERFQAYPSKTKQVLVATPRFY